MNNHTLSPMKLGIVLCGLFLLPAASLAQNVSAGVATRHDGNVFETYLPIQDQVTEISLEASKDWDFDQSAFGLAYFGTGYLYNSTTIRNYHLHSASFSTQYQFYKDDEEEESDDPDDSTASDDPPHPQVPTPPRPHRDSLDSFIYGVINAIGQFNKQEFAEYDNDAVTGTVTFRQPFSEWFTLRPAYSISYHAYPHFEGLGNIQQSVMLTAGIDLGAKTWLSLTGAFGHERYTEELAFSFTYSDSVPGSNGSGHGKGHGKGNGTPGGPGTSTTRTLDYSYTTPSIDQFLASALLRKSFGTETDCSLEGSFYGTPTSGARVIPERIQSAVESRGGALGGAEGQTEIFDDHFTYLGSQLVVQLRQRLPFDFRFYAGGIFKHKRFGTPATGILGDTLAPNRRDTRYETIFELSRPIAVGGEIVQLTAEFHYLRNISNEPFYDFDKTVISAGVMMNF